MRKALAGFFIGIILAGGIGAAVGGPSNRTLRERVRTLERQAEISQESNQRLARFIWCHETPWAQKWTFEECEERIEEGIIVRGRN